MDMQNPTNGLMSFDLQKNQSSIIKVIGVGGAAATLSITCTIRVFAG